MEAAISLQYQLVESWSLHEGGDMMGQSTVYTPKVNFVLNMRAVVGMSVLPSMACRGREVRFGH